MSRCKVKKILKIKKNSISLCLQLKVFLAFTAKDKLNFLLKNMDNERLVNYQCRPTVNNTCIKGNTG
jgi:hypothetical protein